MKLSVCADQVEWLVDRFKSISASKETAIEYKKLAELMFARAERQGCLGDVILNTKSIRTYQKRISAIRHFVITNIAALGKLLPNHQEIDLLTSRQYRRQKVLRKMTERVEACAEFLRVVLRSSRADFRPCARGAELFRYA